MKQKPILFSTPMVESILEGRKVQTRRVVKYPLKSKTHHLSIGENKEVAPPLSFCPYEIGMVLWVRETWQKNDIPMSWPYYYKAANETFNHPENEKWKPSIFMPKEACRLYLEITNIRIERLQAISTKDALSEGVKHVIDKVIGYCGYNYIYGCYNLMTTPWHGFNSLWRLINGQESWDANPWVWVIEFKKIEKPD